MCTTTGPLPQAPIASLYFQREGILVQARRPRTKPDRTPGQAKARVEAWSKRPASFFAEKVDMIIDNKKFDIPTTERARKCLQLPFTYPARGELARDDKARPQKESSEYRSRRQRVCRHQRRSDRVVGVPSGSMERQSCSEPVQARFVFPDHGRWLKNVPALFSQAHSKTDDFRLPAVHWPADGLPAPIHRAGEGWFPDSGR